MKISNFVLAAVLIHLTPAQAALWGGTTTTCQREDYVLVIEEETGLFKSSSLELKQNRKWSLALASESCSRQMIAFGAQQDSKDFPEILQHALAVQPATAKAGGEALYLDCGPLAYVELSTPGEITLKTRERSTGYFYDRESGLLLRFDVETQCQSDASNSSSN